MLFDSSQFILFFIIVYSIYLCLRHRAQNVFLLGASYFFYGFWSWKFLALMLVTQVVDYHISLAMNRLDDQRLRKRLMWLSVAVNMGTLGFFKYFNFFTDNLQSALTLFGMPVSDLTLSIVLPVGISFYTIQELTYILDVYRRRVKPATNFIDFALFISYFPQLVAGPIERAERLLPQIQTPRQIQRNDLYEGGWLILWGLFKKAFVADRLALLVDPIFASPETASGPMVMLAAIGFTFQIYADFSGYSDIAVGLGRLMGFRLMYNFNLPFFAKGPSDYWRRWHISLSQCLRDNLYIPLGGNRQGMPREVLALMVTMLIGGLWHGAQWHFVLWGLYCGLLLVAERTLRWINSETHLSSAKFPFGILIMFPLTVFGFLIFRAENIKELGIMLGSLNQGWLELQTFLPGYKELVICTTLLMIYQFTHFFSGDRFIALRLPLPVRVMLYLLVYFSLTLGAPYEARNFIYFQF